MQSLTTGARTSAINQQILQTGLVMHFSQTYGMLQLHIIKHMFADEIKSQKNSIA